MQHRYVSISARLARVVVVVALAAGGCGNTVMNPDLIMCEGSVCGLGCGSDTDCAVHPGRHRCELTSMTCVPCLQDTDCGPGQQCQTSTHTCIDFCNAGPCDGGVCEVDAHLCVECVVS